MKRSLKETGLKVNRIRSDGTAMVGKLSYAERFKVQRWDVG